MERLVAQGLLDGDDDACEVDASAVVGLGHNSASVVGRSEVQTNQQSGESLGGWRQHEVLGLASSSFQPRFLLWKKCPD